MSLIFIISNGSIHKVYNT